MRRNPRLAAICAWGAVLLALGLPVALAATSPWLSYRNPAYVIASFAGIGALALMLLQPLLAAGYLPGPGLVRARRWHRWLGAGIVLGTALHVGGLFLTSPDDTLDALLLVAPTPFSVYGVTAMWAILATGLLVLLRRRLGLTLPVWRMAHNALALVAVLATIIHALQIEGTMEPLSKWALCVGVLAASLFTLFDLRLRRPLLRWRGRQPNP